MQLPHASSLLGAHVVHLPLDLVECTEQLQRFLGQCAVVVAPQIVEFPARMREAANLGHARGEQRLVSRVVVAHELTRPAGEKFLRVHGSATVREIVNDAIRHRIASSCSSTDTRDAYDPGRA